ncbi:MAG: acyl-CoA dehydrogenase family protein [Desulfarculus sp.]|nr:acyl-CoA dehydrogenase family protein [Pseudomonadota bacterium]MBU4598580.1 acyl-CoA dehydrogenase family protein [Pseudomonadota bacterium]MBV1716431.1 acyl-CoA dehydrogenase family protein [Desulfarculus sp.]MBV1736915.1 acyl-CoA dehydrogenase family protein [Desulfarculus sp.]MBV1752775.1 acyl-CoA dehydrogenase family protein [Desulfarculus sp.]
MDFEISENIRLMTDTIRRFVKKDLEPISQQVEDEDRIPEEVVQTMRELGLFGLSIPEEYGGLGLNVLGECLVYEEMSAVNACFRTRIGTNNGIGSQGIVIDGTEEQKQKYLPKMASGEWIGVFALTEPEAGSDAANVQTTAELKGDKWVLNGRKHFITNGDIADVSTVFAVTDKAKRAKGGITGFLVEKTDPGFFVGTIERKMGMRGSHTSELIFDNCEIPKDRIIGGDANLGLGFRTAMKILDKGRLTMGASAVGSAQKLLDLSVEYAKQRVQFGKPIGEFQAVQIMLADMATQIYAGRQMLHHAAWLRDKRGTAVVKEASMVKLFCTEMANRVADMAVQIHGGMGYMKDFPVERFYRDLRLTRIYEGTSEIQRNVIARELLKG